MDVDDEPMLLADLPLAPAPARTEPAEEGQPYRVLARKYRPRTFSELLGQDAMVRTLSNAIARERIPHALIMTGGKQPWKQLTVLRMMEKYTKDSSQMYSWRSPWKIHCLGILVSFVIS